MNHALCDECWRAREGARVPVRLTKPRAEVCCSCGQRTTSGILVRTATRMEHCAHER